MVDVVVVPVVSLFIDHENFHRKFSFRKNYHFDELFSFDTRSFENYEKVQRERTHKQLFSIYVVCS
jgi:hypothetical protein